MNKPDFWLPPITEEERTPHGCLVCDDAGMKPIKLPMDAIIGVGFGSAGVTCDGHCRWEEQEANGDFDKIITVQIAENMAKLEPDKDWRIFYYGPLSEREYQRQGDGNWVLIKQGQGFA